VTDAAAPVIVRMEHARALDYCARGVRGWCAAHGIDYLAFVREGLPLDDVLALGDELGRRVAEVAQAEAVARRSARDAA
jgi:hypothetical protein